MDKSDTKDGHLLPKQIAFARLFAQAESLSISSGSFAHETRVRNVRETVRFLRAWIANPLEVGAVIPSSRALAELITSEISPETGHVIELGPGTGVFTQALLERGVRERQLTLIEAGLNFSDELSNRFPRARIVQMDAAHLCQAALFPEASVGAIVSGLPLLAMSPQQIAAILSGAFGYLREGGAFYQFTYGFRCPVPRQILDRLGLTAVRIGRVVANFPPAAAYRISISSCG